MRPALLLCLALALLPVPSLGLTIDPTASALTPAVGAAEPLSGTLQLAIGQLPVTGNTTFDVVSLLATTGAGTGIRLDPASPSPGLGVIDSAGSFLIATLFLEIEDPGGAFPLGIPDVRGQATFDASGTLLLELQVDPFEIDPGGPGGVLGVTLRALPEPGSLALLGLAGLVVAGLGREGR
jgi:hypothetical protein